MECPNVLEELTRVKTEYAAFQETSQLYEAELEAELATVNASNEALLRANRALQAEVSNLKQTLQGKVVELQRENAQSLAELTDRASSHEALLKNLKALETEVETNRSRLREKEYELAETTDRYNQALEELTLTDCELETVRTHAQEHMRRLQENITELSEELNRNRRAGNVYKRRPLCVNNHTLSMVDALMNNIQGRMKRIH